MGKKAKVISSDLIRKDYIENVIAPKIYKVGSFLLTEECFTSANSESFMNGMKSGITIAVEELKLRITGLEEQFEKGLDRVACDLKEGIDVAMKITEKNKNEKFLDRIGNA